MIADALFLPNYLKSFRARGLPVFWRVYRPKRDDRLFAVNVADQTYWLRNTISDKSIFVQMIVQREYETQHWPALHQRLEGAYRRILDCGKTPIIIDAGANIGLSARWFAARYPQARIYAIEPDDENLAVLRRNIETLPNTTVLPGALWDRETGLHISNLHAGSAALRAVEGNGYIRAYTVPEIMNMAEGELFIAKIDIEGGEEAVFRSNTEWLASPHLLVIELHDWLYPGQGTSRKFLKRISEHPMDIVFRGENLFCFAVK